MERLRDPMNLLSNLSKLGSVEGFDGITKRTVRLFNPRNAKWNDHFRLTIPSARIIGRTATGRVTVQVLNMNSAAQLIARANWIRTGLVAQDNA